MLLEFGNQQDLVSVIGQGTMGLGGRFDPDCSQDRACVEALRLGIDLGMNFVDTAEVYGGGHAEELVGAVIRERRREDVFLATKVSPEHLRYADVVSSCERSLLRLGLDHIDLYQVHWPNPAIPVGETMSAMVKLQEQGKVRCIGVSNFSRRQCQEAVEALGETPLASNQVEYNLFDRTIEDDLLPYCQEAGITVVAYSPLNQGGVAPTGQGPRLLEDLARKYGCTWAQLALSWATCHPRVVAIPKARRLAHVRDNAAAMALELSEDDLEAIDAAFPTRPVEVATHRIKVALDGIGNRAVYQTVEQALENARGFVPSPEALARDLRRRKEFVKPVRVRPAREGTSEYDYELVEGRIRYWAWVIAYGGKRPIPALVRE